MLSVQLPAEEALAIAGRELSLAAVNAPSLCVLSGTVGAIAAAEQALKERGVDCARVHIRVAAHSSMLDPLLPEFERFCRTISFQRPAAPFVSSVTGSWISDAEATDPAYRCSTCARPCASPMRCRRCSSPAKGRSSKWVPGARSVVSCGSRRATSRWSRRPCVTRARRPPMSAFLLAAIGRLWAAGVELDAGAAVRRETRRRVPLPTYPFERQRFWISPDAQGRAAGFRCVREARRHRRLVPCALVGAFGASRPLAVADTALDLAGLCRRLAAERSSGGRPAPGGPWRGDRGCRYAVR